MEPTTRVTTVRLKNDDIFKLNFIHLYLKSKGVLQTEEQTELFRIAINSLYVNICNAEGIQHI